MTQTPGQDPDKDRRMAEALDRGMPAGLAAQAVYGWTPKPESPVSIELTISLDMRADEVWPDGLPSAWTAQDVLTEMQKLSAERVIKDWDLLTFGAEVEVQTLGTSARGKLQ